MAKKAPNPIDKHVGSRVRMRRMMLGMSQEKLGDALGLTFQQVQKYEKGTNRIGASRLQQISLILQVPVSFFFEGAPAPPGRPCGLGEAPRPTYVTDFLATTDGLALVKAFMRIENAQAAPPHRRPRRGNGRTRKRLTPERGARARHAHRSPHLDRTADAARNAAVEPRHSARQFRANLAAATALPEESDQCPARIICSPASPFPKAIPTRCATRFPMRSSTRSWRTTSSSASRTTARSTRGSAARR